MSYIDTHVHLDSDAFKDCLPDILALSRQAGLKAFIIPAASFETFSFAKKIAKQNLDVYLAVGIHPNDIPFSKNIESTLLQNLKDSSKVVAIGECGLDFYVREEKITKATINNQIKYFRFQIELALKNNLPLIIHSRDSNDLLAEILGKYKNEEALRGVFHCYSPKEINCPLLEFKDRFFYGIGGVSTFKNAAILQELIKIITESRIILETDAPYLAPHPFRGKVNNPSYLPIILAKISQILQKDEAYLKQRFLKQSKELFGLEEIC